MKAKKSRTIGQQGWHSRKVVPAKRKASAASVAADNAATPEAHEKAAKLNDAAVRVMMDWAKRYGLGDTPWEVGARAFEIAADHHRQKAKFLREDYARGKRGA